jgi:amino acid transporter
MANSKKMSFNATWSMAVGGMVGGGIFSVLGVVIEKAGKWAWLSFLLAGCIALIAAHSYSQLSIKYNEGGGAFTFLRKINHKGFAGSLSWVLILGYTLTISVYAFTFGEYVAHVFHTIRWLPQLLAFSIISILAILNLRGVSNATLFEIVTVYGKLIVLLGLAVWGLKEWDVSTLTRGIEVKPWSSAIIGATTIFMAYEGFQLLSYDYESLQDPTKTLPRATLLAVISVIGIYILVTLGATMLVGADKIVEQKEVALAVAGKQALGTLGLVLVTIAAAFSTGSAINATLFSTARLMESISHKGDLPQIFFKENKQDIPYYAVISVSVVAIVLALIGNLGSLVDSASLIFLITFGVVCFIAYSENVKFRYLCLGGAIACGIAVVLAVRDQWEHNPLALAGMGLLILFIFLVRPIAIKRF